MIERVFEELNLNIGNIVSATTDNGSNVLKASNGLLGEVENGIAGLENAEVETEIEEQRQREEERQLDEEDDGFVVNTQFESEVIEAVKLIAKEHTGGLRCVAHVIQLAVNKYLKNFKEELAKIKETTKILLNRLRKNRRGCKKLPLLANATRWSSTFYMVSALNPCLYLKVLIIERNQINYAHFISFSRFQLERLKELEDDLCGDDEGLDWIMMTDLKVVLQPAEKLTRALQAEQYTAVDFRKDYFHCISAVKKLVVRPDLVMVRPNMLLDAFKKYEKYFMDNVNFKSPQFNGWIPNG